MLRRLYLDAAAQQPVYPEAEQAALRAFRHVGNPSALHEEGQRARGELAAARKACAEYLHVSAESCVLTSGTTEGTNTVLATYKGKGPLVLSAGEHPATVQAAAATGNEVRIVPINKDGLWSVEDAVQAATGAALLSLAIVHGETGVRQPIEALHRALRGRVALHVDAAQLVAWENCVEDAWGAEYVTFGGGKVGAGAGIGVLFARPGAPLAPLLYGGAQERGRRAGTENSVGAAAFAAALAQCAKHRAVRARRVAGHRAQLEHALQRAGATILGAHAPRAPHILAAHVPGRDAEELVLRANALGLAVSAGTACRRPRAESSTYAALGVPPQEVIRLSLPWNWTWWQTRRAVAVLRQLLHTHANYENSAHR